MRRRTNALGRSARAEFASARLAHGRQAPPTTASQRRNSQDSCILLGGTDIAWVEPWAMYSAWWYGPQSPPPPWQRRFSISAFVPENFVGFYYHIMWTIAYALVVCFFLLSSSPLIGTRRHRLRWHPYTLSYSIASLFIMANLIGVLQRGSN
jgi:hypothetical protein